MSEAKKKGGLKKILLLVAIGLGGAALGYGLGTNFTYKMPSYRKENEALEIEVETVKEPTLTTVK